MLKQTKIVATISDLRCEEGFVRDLLRAGVNVLRLNTAHQSPQGMGEAIDKLRGISDTVALLIDTKGPEIRTSMGGAPVEAQLGVPVYVHGDSEGHSGGDQLYINLASLVSRVPLGSSLLIDDGELELVVVDKTESMLTCLPQSAGVIKPRKSVNIPNVPIDLPTLSSRDREFLCVVAEKQVEFVAHSFVRTRDDVIEVQDLLAELGASAKVIAKIENQQGVDNIDQILDYAYGIMVARGDLGIEIPGERVPEVQRMIVGKCIESKKPVIIATQMLHTMIENPRPTRAEISDVANAIHAETDAIMLSGETAYGKYSESAVETMTRIAQEVERNLPPLRARKLHRVANPVTETLARAAVEASVTMRVKAIVVDTLSGQSARYLSAFRGRVPVYAMCYRPEVMRQLQLSYGIEPHYMEMRTTREDFLRKSLSLLLEKGKFAAEDLIVVLGGSFGPSAGVTFMEICQAHKILDNPLIHEA